MSTSPTSGSRTSTHARGAFAFLSEYEGLGLTPLEALAAGVPPVLLDTPVARESCGDAALYVPAGRGARDHARARRGAVRRGDTLANSRRRAGRARAIQLAARRPRNARGARSRRVGRRTIAAAMAARGGGIGRWIVCRSSSCRSTRGPISSAASASLHAAPPAIAHEIIVVDNASTDGSVDAARRWPDVRVIEMSANVGFARATMPAFARRPVTRCCSSTAIRSCRPERSIGSLAELDRDPERRRRRAAARRWQRSAQSCRSAG